MAKKRTVEQLAKNFSEWEYGYSTKADPRYIFLTSLAFAKSTYGSGTVSSEQIVVEQNTRALEDIFKKKMGISSVELFKKLNESIDGFENMAKLYEALKGQRVDMLMSTNLVRESDMIDTLRESAADVLSAQGAASGVLKTMVELRKISGNISTFNMLLPKGKVGKEMINDHVGSIQDLVRKNGEHLAVVGEAIDVSSFMSNIEWVMADLLGSLNNVQSKKMIAGKDKEVLQEHMKSRYGENLSKFLLRDKKPREYIESILKILNSESVNAKDVADLKMYLAKLNTYITTGNTAPLARSAELVGTELTEAQVRGALGEAVKALKLDSNVASQGSGNFSIKLDGDDEIYEMKNMIADGKIVIEIETIDPKTNEKIMKEVSIGMSAKAYASLDSNVGHSSYSLANYLALSGVRNGGSSVGLTKPLREKIVNMFVLAALGGKTPYFKSEKGGTRLSLKRSRKQSVKAVLQDLIASNERERKLFFQFYANGIFSVFAETEFMFVNGALIPSSIYYEMAMKEVFGQSADKMASFVDMQKGSKSDANTLMGFTKFDGESDAVKRSGPIIDRSQKMSSYIKQNTIRMKTVTMNYSNLKMRV